MLSTIVRCGTLRHDYKKCFSFLAKHLARAPPPPVACLLTCPGSLSKQIPSEHKQESAEHLAFSNCWCAAVYCCHQKLLVCKLWPVWGPRYLMSVWNCVVCVMKFGENYETLHNICLSERRFLEWNGGMHTNTASQRNLYDKYGRFSRWQIISLISIC